MIKSIPALLAATAALLPTMPASASLLGDSVVIKRIQGGNVFKTVASTVGDGFEYSDNFFDIDINENAILFDGGNSSIGQIDYTIDGLDFDDNPATANVVTDFTAFRIFGTPGHPAFDASRLTISPNGQIRLSFANTVSGADSFARITLGAATPTGVPEPDSWAMMIGGFALAGAASRRRKNRAPAVLA